METAPAPRVIRFLDVDVDVATETVRRADQEVRLRHKSFQVLFYLLTNRNRLVSRDELFDAVWDGAAVTEDTLVQCVVEIRKALGDDPRSPRFVRTIPKRGYHFIAPSDEALPPAVATQPPERKRPYWPALAAFAAGSAILVTMLALARSDGLDRAAAPDRAVTSSAIPAAMTTSPEAYRLYALGVARANELRQEEAVALFERALRIDPQFAMAHARIGYAYGVRGYEAARARPYIERALALGTRLSEKDRLIVEGWRLIIANDFENAIGQFQLITDKYPTEVESLLRLANLLTGEERITESLAVLEKARLIDPTRPDIYNALGLYSRIGRHDLSIAARRRYVELRPEEPNAWDSLASSYHAAGRYDEALAQYERALALDPAFVIARYHRASTLVDLGRFREAIADVKECLAQAADDRSRDRALCTLADLYRLSGDHQRELEVARTIRVGTQWVPLAASDASGDQAAMDSLLELGSQFNARGARLNRRKDFYMRGYAALNRGDAEEALRLFRESDRFQPLLWYIDRLDTGVADTCLRLGRFREAADAYARLLELNPNHARALLGRAQANEGLGNLAAARADYRHFLELWKGADPDARDLATARAKLKRLG